MKVLGKYDSSSSSSSTNTMKRNDKTKPKKATMTKPIESSSSTTSTSKSYPSWHNVVAGAAAGAGARFFTAPLDLLKIRRQLVTSSSSSASAGATGFSPLGLFHSLRDIVQKEGGLPSLFRGNLAATYLWIGYAAVQFSLYTRTSDILSQSQFLLPPAITSSLPPPFVPPLQHAATSLQSITSNPSAVAFCSGAFAGTAATLATYPFDICRTAFAARGLTTLEPRSIQSFFKDAIMNVNVNGSSTGGVGLITNPLRNLFAGCGPAVLGIIPYMGINFALYDYLVRKGEKTKAIDAGAAGAIAGGTSKLIVYPLDTVKKRLQAQAFNKFEQIQSKTITSSSMNTVEYKNMMDCATRIMKEEGMLTFYRGLVPTLLKTMTATGLTFAIFTFTKNTLETTHDWCTVKKNAQVEEDR